MGFLGDSVVKESALSNARDPGSGGSLGVGNGDPRQYSCLENMERSLAGWWQRVRHNWTCTHNNYSMWNKRFLYEKRTSSHTLGSWKLNVNGQIDGDLWLLPVQHPRSVTNNLWLSCFGYHTVSFRYRLGGIIKTPHLSWPGQLGSQGPLGQ